MKSLDSLVHGLLLEVGEQLCEVRAGNGQACQYTTAVVVDTTLEGCSVREGHCGLGVEAGGQKLIMIQAFNQSVTSNVDEVGHDVIDLVARDRAGVVEQLEDERC